jgi:hypothetical protein
MQALGIGSNPSSDVVLDERVMLFGDLMFEPANLWIRTASGNLQELTFEHDVPEQRLDRPRNSRLILAGLDDLPPCRREAPGPSSSVEQLEPEAVSLEDEIPSVIQDGGLR